MATMKEHLAGFHKHAMEHHETLHQCYKTLSAFGKSAKSEMKPDQDGASLCDTLEEIAECHKAASAFHKNMMAECAKLSAGGDLSKAASEDFGARLEKLENTIVPSGVSKVTPNAPRAVPRFGSAPMQRPAVPLAFEHLSRIEE